MKKGDLLKAESSYLDALKGESNLFEAHLALGDIAIMRKDISQAEQEYRAAAELAPEAPLVK